MSKPYDPAVSLKPGDILVATNSESGLIFRVDPVSGEASVAFSDGELPGTNLTGLEFDLDGSLLVSGFDRIVRIDPQTGGQTKVAGSPVLQDPLPTFWTDVAPAPEGRLFATVEKSATFVEVDTSSGNITPIDLAEPPNSLEPGPNGAVFVAASDTLVRFDPASGQHEVVLSQNAFSNDFAVADDGTIYIVRQQEVVRFAPGSEQPHVVSSGGDLKNPHGIAIEASGNLVVSDLETDSVLRVDVGGGGQQVLASGGVLERVQKIVVVPGWKK